MHTYTHTHIHTKEQVNGIRTSCNDVEAEFDEDAVDTVEIDSSLSDEVDADEATATTPHRRPNPTGSSGERRSTEKTLPEMSKKILRARVQKEGPCGDERSTSPLSFV